MTTDARVTGIEFQRPQGDSPARIYSHPSDMTKPIDDRVRTMTTTYEWYGVGVPSNLPEVVKNHPELVHINFGV